MEHFLKQFEQALLDLDRVAAARVLGEALRGRTVVECLEALLPPALLHIGGAWERGELALSQVYMSARIGEELALRHLPSGAQSIQGQPRLAIGVFEDNHALGKRIVQAVLQAAGYRLTDYGTSLVADDLAGRVARDQIEVLLLSTLTLRAALALKTCLPQLRQARPGLRVVVGGAPFLLEPKLWLEVGADAMGRNATDALALVRRSHS